VALEAVDDVCLSDTLRLFGTAIRFHVDARLIHDPSYCSDAAAALNLATQAAVNLAGRARARDAGKRKANVVVGQHIAGTHNHELDPGTIVNSTI
jgi:hypothetical protein